jgi:two-component system cell cycle response regulator
MDRATFHALQAGGRLPSPEGVALHLLRLIQRDNVSTREIADVIMSDPALAGRVIASANSVSHYGHRPVVSIAQAIAVNGTAATSRLVLGLSIISAHQTGRCQGFDYPRFWLRSVVTALGMQAGATQSSIAAPAEVFTLGLLNRIGVLALATLHPQDYGSLLAGAADGIATLEQEQQRFATDHLELGQYLLEDWGIPQAFRDAAVQAEDEPATEGVTASRLGKLAALLRVARAMADTAADHDFRHLEDAPAQRAALQIGLARDELFSLWDTVAEAWPAWGRILNVHVDPLPRQCAPLPLVAPEAREASALAVQDTDAPLRVLALCGESPLRTELCRLLDMPGIRLCVAATDDDALKLGVALQPQLVVIDLSGRAASGLKICQILRSSAIGRAAYILALSAEQGERAHLDALHAGADEFLGLPASTEVLEAHLRVARRLVSLKEEVKRDREEIRHYAAELAVANQRLQDLAGSDPLTGLPNRRYAMDDVTQAWQTAVVSGEPLACLMIDIDNFKRINDTHGHDVGDRVLAAIAQVLRANARAQDTVCRIGGEEFLVVCRATDVDTARLAGERLRAVVQATPIEMDGISHPVSISVGVSAVGRGSSNASVLLKQADQALYRAKQHGRNRVEVT